MRHRQIKKKVAQLLAAPDTEAGMAALCELPARQAVNPLFGLLYAGEPMIRWRAVSAMGAVVSNLADRSMEQARIIMRRFMWNLNDESGGIGWGSPESMGDIMARHPGLAKEYAAMLVSYADPEGNFLEHPGLQPGVLWGLGRLGRVHPELVQRIEATLPFFLTSSEPIIRGMAVWAAAPLKAPSLRTIIESMEDDAAEIIIYIDGNLKALTMAELTREALSTGAALS